MDLRQVGEPFEETIRFQTPIFQRLQYICNWQKVDNDYEDVPDIVTQLKKVVKRIIL